MNPPFARPRSKNRSLAQARMAVSLFSLVTVGVRAHADLPRSPLWSPPVFSSEIATERRHYLTIVLRPVVLVILLMWVCLPV